MKRSTLEAIILAGIVLALAAAGYYATVTVCCPSWPIRAETRIVQGTWG